ncbi:MAG: helix-turn-helix domain-containing protein [Hyphomicrobiales bacterium]|nr:helix-turn-helix domain-containing protein [Hyphomicrobiales bacterium]
MDQSTAVLRDAPACECSEMCRHCETRALSVCSPLEGEAFYGLQRLNHPVTFPARAVLFNQDSPARHVYTIVHGVVRLYKLLPDGRRQIVGFALPGDFLGLALADGYGFCADAVTAVSACRFSRDHFAEFADQYPTVLRRLHEMATHELALAQQQMVLLGRRDAEEKIASFLLALQQRWGRIHGKTSVTIDLPMGRQDIADFLGLTIETVSRTLNRMARDRLLVIVPDGVRVLDAAKLDKLASA